MTDLIKLADTHGLEVVDLEVRTLDGADVLMTTDGKILANQCTQRPNSGHVFYCEAGKLFRASFLMDNKLIKQQGPVER